MKTTKAKKICYVLGLYPNLSETFIQREISYFLSHEYEVFIYSLKVPSNNIREKCLIDSRINLEYFQQAVLKSLLKNFFYNIKNPKGFITSLFYILKGVVNQTPNETFRLMVLFVASSGLLSYTKKNNLKFIHSHFANASLMCLFAKQMNKIFQYSFTLHASADIYNRPLLLVEQFSFAKKIITISEYNANFLQRYFNEDHIDKLSVIRNGVEIIPFKFKNNSEEKLSLLSVGNYDYAKGFDILVEAIDIINRLNSNCELIIVGDGPQFRSIERNVKSKKLNSIIKLVGAKSHLETIKYFQQADIFIHASAIDFGGRRDGFPTVILEAVSHSLPVITTYVSGIPELIINDITGIIVPEGNPKLLAQSILNMISEHDKRESLARKAHKKLEESYDINKTTQQLEKLLIG